jgi:hypothetical protein
MSDILFESNTEEPEEFEFNGETIENFGDVKIVSKEFMDKIFNDSQTL